MVHSLGARFEKGKWSADASIHVGRSPAERETLFAKVNLDYVFGRRLGRTRRYCLTFIWRGGVRRLALDILCHRRVRQRASRSPGFWDPIVGLTYRRQRLGRKWRILIHGDGGGFGVASSGRRRNPQTARAEVAVCSSFWDYDGVRRHAF